MLAMTAEDQWRMWAARISLEAFNDPAVLCPAPRRPDSQAGLPSLLPTALWVRACRRQGAKARAWLERVRALLLQAHNWFVSVDGLGSSTSVLLVWAAMEAALENQGADLGAGVSQLLVLVPSALFLLQGTKDFYRYYHHLTSPMLPKLWTLCTYFAHTLHTLCTHFAHTLHALSTHFAHILRTLRTYFAHALHTLCTHFAHILRTLRTYFARTLHTLCTHVAHTSHTLCTQFAHTSHTLCTHFAHITLFSLAPRACSPYCPRWSPGVSPHHHHRHHHHHHHHYYHHHPPKRSRASWT
jgi:hypothetical protein